MATPEYFVSIKLLNCRNLPKADVLGKIDPYVKFLAQVDTVTSSTKKRDYNPDYNENFGIKISLPLNHIVGIEVWDWDAVGKDDRMAWTRFTVQPGYKQYHNVPLEMKKGTKGHNGDPTISFEVVALRDPAGYRNVPGAIPSLFSKNSAAAFLGGDAVLQIEFEKGRVDVKAYSTFSGKYVSLGYGLPNFEYKIRFQRFQGGKDIGAGVTAYSEAKLDDIPADFRLDLVKIYIADETLKENTNLEAVSESHGWSGSLAYKDAKKTLRNITYDDKSETVYMSSPSGTFLTKVDWDSKNVDFGAFLYEKTQKESKVIEVTAKGYNKQTHTYFAGPKTSAEIPLPVTMKAGVDDVKYGTMNEDIHFKVYQLSNISVVNFIDVFNVYR